MQERLAEIGFRHVAASDNRTEQRNESNDGDHCDVAGLDEAQPQAHTYRDGDGHTDGENAPGRIGQRVHADHGEHGQHDHEHHEDHDGGHGPADLPDFIHGHLAEAASAATHGEEEDEHVLDGAGHAHPEDNPQGAGQVAHLGGQHRAHQRAGTGDSGEVMPVEHHAVRRVEIASVIDAFGRRRVGIVGLHNGFLNKERVEAVGDHVGTDRCHHEPRRIDLFTAIEGEHVPARNAEGCYEDPHRDARQRPLRMRFCSDRNTVAVPDNIFFLFLRILRKSSVSWCTHS